MRIERIEHNLGTPFSSPSLFASLPALWVAWAAIHAIYTGIWFPFPLMPTTTARIHSLLLVPALERDNNCLSATLLYLQHRHHH